MRLSEAIRLGSMMNPQGFGWFSRGQQTCAIGAAHKAIGGFKNVPEEWAAVLSVASAECPACSHVRITDANSRAGGAIIVHLNDYHRWSRERIADWVESVERAQTPQVETVSVPAQEQAVELGAQRKSHSSTLDGPS
jgi:hypothetical protein